MTEPLPHDFKNPWKKLSSKEYYDNPWMKIEEDQVIRPDGNPGIYGKVLCKKIAVGVIPVDEDGYTWIVGQYRYTINRYSWEIPEGGSDPGEDPKETAFRELREETGVQAQELIPILKIYLSNCITDEVGYCYLAKGLSFGEASPDETEDLQIKKVKLDEVIEYAYQGQIIDSLAVAALMKLRVMKDRGEVHW